MFAGVLKTTAGTSFRRARTGFVEFVGRKIQSGGMYATPLTVKGFGCGTACLPGTRLRRDPQIWRTKASLQGAPRYFLSKPSYRGPAEARLQSPPRGEAEKKTKPPPFGVMTRLWRARRGQAAIRSLEEIPRRPQQHRHAQNAFQPVSSPG